MINTLYIGIDPGTHTGVAVWNHTDRRLESVETMTITQAMEVVRDSHDLLNDYTGIEYEVVVFIEDARKRNWFGNAGRGQLQGAGSIKRDCAIWETFCEELGIECRKIAPKNNYTKLSPEQFKVLTGWSGRTSEHSRDAAMLVFGR